MESRSLGSIILSAVIVGLIAGLLVAAFHFVLTEPIIERSIEIESSLRQVQEATAETLLVDRDAQRAGLFLGFLLYGLTWGLLFSVLYHIVQNPLRDMSTFSRSSTLALLTGWSVALFPFLKYPANPPGVGDPETIQYRQTFYLAFIALSVAITCLAFVIQRYLSRPHAAGRSPWSKWAIVLGAYAVPAVLLYIAFPPNPDPVPMPASLVEMFRILSFAGLALFWLAYAVGFAWLAVRAERPERAKNVIFAIKKA
ncbi:MAG: CbtA family protein [Chloroflexi bacterium]|nr:CbtA family protein [Chloroflexota bacterium]